MSTNADLAELLFPDVKLTIEDLEKKYPPRNLPEGAQVTRFAPSPTGFLHTGSLFTSMVSYLTAKKSGGVYFFRLEDTDTKRTIEGSGDLLIKQLSEFGIVADEGYFPEGDKGDYGPYKQSERKDIYRAVIKELVKLGRAYPDFCTPEDLDAIRKFQEAHKILPGYYGAYARDRNLSVDERIEKIKAGTPWVIRFKSNGDHDKKTKFTDAIRGEIELQDNDTDVVILKSDGLPTYHFAHVCDDHFMRTTIITRGEEWIPSTPIHLDMFRALGWKAPKYAHIPSIMKLDHGNKRKLSKRKDPEAAVSYFLDNGYCPQALLVYLMSIANSNFEEWSIAHKSFDLNEFPFSLNKMSLDGALFDEGKLNYFSKEVIAKMPLEELFAAVSAYAHAHDEKFAARIDADPEYIKKILNIEKERKNPRKDYAKYSDIYPLIRFFFHDEWENMFQHGLPFAQAKSLVKKLDLSDADAEVFTKLYVEYQDTLRGLRASQPRPDRRQKRDEITDEEADRRITSAIAFSRQEADLKEAYYAKFREHFSPSQLLSVFERRPMVMPRQGNNNRPPFGGPQGGGFGPGW